MLYTRSSFIKWLTEVKDCEVYPLGSSNVMVIKCGIFKANMWVTPKDLIDYEEIYILCSKIPLIGLPGDNDLIKVE
jgi:hypothetical protein